MEPAPSTSWTLICAAACLVGIAPIIGVVLLAAFLRLRLPARRHRPDRGPHGNGRFGGNGRG